VPLPHIADFFANAGKWLVIEFVPKSDSQVRKLLVSRKDIFSNYICESFEAAFTQKFSIREKAVVEDSERFLYLMENKDN
jgi:hypothetical protein